MKTFDFAIYLITYNFIIGVLLMLSSEKLGACAGYLLKPYREKVSRLAQVGTFAFGACVAVLSSGIYLAAYVLNL